ncbi:MAG: hypothetical protein FWD25_01835 [Clostridia bacterium]|nr:hypothetical protein [Clostridia bacterium]
MKPPLNKGDSSHAQALAKNPQSPHVHDRVGQLTQFTKSDRYAESYRYDAVGNMKQRALTQNGRTTRINMNHNATNRMTSMSSPTGRIRRLRYLPEEGRKSSIHTGGECIVVYESGKLECECMYRYEMEIDSIRLLKEIAGFFDDQTNRHIFDSIPVQLPFYVGYSGTEPLSWYANKWYKCNVCGCLWEVNNPDFPAFGFVRKFENGHYHPK